MGTQENIDDALDQLAIRGDCQVLGLIERYRCCRLRDCKVFRKDVLDFISELEETASAAVREFEAIISK
jgi:hypothetical protein